MCLCCMRFKETAEKVAWPKKPTFFHLNVVPKLGLHGRGRRLEAYNLEAYASLET